jgi:hypothetical protein
VHTSASANAHTHMPGLTAKSSPIPTQPSTSASPAMPHLHISSSSSEVMEWAREGNCEDGEGLGHGGGSRRKLDMGGEGESAGVTGNMDQGEEGGNRVRLGSGGVGNGHGNQAQGSELITGGKRDRDIKHEADLNRMEEDVVS